MSIVSQIIIGFFLGMGLFILILLWIMEGVCGVVVGIGLILYSMVLLGDSKTP